MSKFICIDINKGMSIYVRKSDIEHISLADELNSKMFRITVSTVKMFFNLEFGDEFTRNKRFNEILEELENE